MGLNKETEMKTMRTATVWMSRTLHDIRNRMQRWVDTQLLLIVMADYDARRTV